jgi:hypothetical protein
LLATPSFSPEQYEQKDLNELIILK